MTTFSAQKLNNGKWGIVSTAPAPSISFMDSVHFGSAGANGVPVRVQLTVDAMNMAYQRSSTYRNLMLQHRDSGSRVQIWLYRGLPEAQKYSSPFGKGPLDRVANGFNDSNLVVENGRRIYRPDPSKPFDIVLGFDIAGKYAPLGTGMSESSLRQLATTIGHEFAHSYTGEHVDVYADKVVTRQELSDDQTYGKQWQMFSEMGGVITIGSSNYAPASLFPNAPLNQPYTDPRTGIVYQIVSADDYLTKAAEYMTIHRPPGALRGGGGTTQLRLLDENGKPVSIPTPSALARRQFFTEAGAVIGGALGNSLANGEKAKGILYSSLLAEVGERLGAAVSTGTWSTVLENSQRNAARDAITGFGLDVWDRMKDAAVGTVSSLLTAELGNLIGVKGFGAELFNVAGSTLVTTVFQNIRGAGGLAELWKGIPVDRVFKGVPGALGGAFGAYFGSKLAAMIVQPATQAGAVLSSVGSAVGSYAAVSATLAGGAYTLTALGSVLIPGVGAFVGFVMGALIGNLFGRQKPRVPTAFAETVLQIPYAQYELGGSGAENGGSLDLARAMAKTARDTLNGLIAQVVEGGQTGWVSNLNGQATDQRYGHRGNELYIKFGPNGTEEKGRYLDGVWTKFVSADEVVDYGALRAIRNTNIVGGDIFAKRAMVRSQANDLANFAGDVQVAADYRFYAGDRGLVNQLIHGAYAALTEGEKTFYEQNKVGIDKTHLNGLQALTAEERAWYDANKPTVDKVIKALEDQSFANPWIITLQRAAELNLDKFAASDFYGGLRGFMDSFDLKSRDLGYEDINFRWRGGPVDVYSTEARAEGLFTTMASAFDAGRGVQVSGIWDIGYTPLGPGEATSGNDFMDRHWDAIGYTMDDYRVDGFGVVHTGGDDIFTGSQGNDYLYGRAGWDWLDGQGGNDWIEGGPDRDVLLGGEGVDRLFGQMGDDYLAGGHGDDRVPAGGGLHGGKGNDVLIGGWGYDDLFGDDDNDLFLLEQGERGQDWIVGGLGSDTVSFERYTNPSTDTNQNGWQGWPQAWRYPSTHFNGVTLDMNARWSDGSVRVYGNGLNEFENATGSRFNDYLWGDSGANVLKGLAGEDLLDGAGGDDVMEGGAGADFMKGWVGINTLSYEGSTGGVYVDLTGGEAFGGDAEGDKWEDIQNIRGSRFADELKGDGQTNRLEGAQGDDWIVATGGGDYLDGAEGFDTVDFSAATDAPVHVSLGSAVVTEDFLGSGSYGIATNTTLAKIEGVVGTQFDDRLSGLGGDHVLQGGKGADYLEGGLGADTYVFNAGDGADFIVESNGDANVLSFREGVNYRWIFHDVRPNSSLLLGVFGAGEVTIDGQMAEVRKNKIKTLDMGGASQLDVSAMEWNIGGSGLDDEIRGSSGKSDFILAHDGHDLIYGAVFSSDVESTGNIIIGGLGNDRIFTSVGDDQFAYDRDHGVDQIYDDGGEDAILFGPSVAAEDVIFEITAEGHLWVGARDLGNPNLTASQVVDRIYVHRGGIVMENGNTGERTYKIDHVNAGGAWIDLRKLELGFKTEIFYPDGTKLPIALDLDGDGIELTSVKDSNIVGRNARGGLSRVGWLGSDDGFLAVDRNGDGQINRLSEISFVQDKAGAKTDLEGLTAWDSNKDGKLDKSDARWGELRVWVDANQNGRSTKGELRTLEAAGITSLDLKGKATGYTGDLTLDSIVHNEIGFTKADGSKGRGYDVQLGGWVIHSQDGETGAKKDEWSKPGEDAEFGRLLNDPRAEFIAERKTQGKPVKDGDVLDYNAVKAKAKLDFSDHDGTYADEEARKKVRSELDAKRKALVAEGKMEGWEHLEALKKANAGKRAAAMATVPERVLPLVFDMDGDGAELIEARDSKVTHDVNGDGTLEKIGWVGADDAILALDRNGDGSIQLTSEISFVGDTPGAKTDLEGLAAFDENGDGVLSAADSAFAKFVLWRDLNGNGASDKGELIGLAAAGFTELELTARARARNNGQVGSNQILGRTVAHMSGPSQPGGAPALSGSDPENAAASAQSEAAGLLNGPSSKLRGLAGRLLGSTVADTDTGTPAQAAASVQDGLKRVADGFGRRFGDERQAPIAGGREAAREDTLARTSAAVGSLVGNRLIRDFDPGQTGSETPAAPVENSVRTFLRSGNVMAQAPGLYEDVSFEDPSLTDPSIPGVGEPSAGDPRSRKINVYDVAFGVAPADQNAPADGSSELYADAEGDFTAPVAGLERSLFDWEQFETEPSHFGALRPDGVAEAEPTPAQAHDLSDTADLIEQARAMLEGSEEAKPDVRRRVAEFAAGRGLGGAWWRADGGAPAEAAGSGRLQSTGQGPDANPEHDPAWAHARQQGQLLRQSLAAFKGDEGASAAVWRRSGEGPIEDTLALAQGSIRSQAGRSIVDLR